MSFYKLLTVAILAGTSACVSKIYFSNLEWKKYNIAQYHSNPLINAQHQANICKKQSGNYVDTFASSQITTHHYDPSSEHKKCNIEKDLNKDEDAEEVHKRVREVKKKVCEMKKEVCEVKKEVSEMKKEVCEMKKEVCEVKKEVSEEVKKDVCEEVKKEVSKEVKTEVSEEVKKEVCEEVKKEVSEEVKKEVCEEVKKEVCEEVEKEVCEEAKVKVCEDTEAKVCEDTEVKDGEDTEVKDGEDTEVKVCEDTEVKDDVDTEVKDGKDTEVKDGEDTEVEDGEDTEVKVCEDRNVKVCEEKRDVCEEKKDVCEEKKDVCEEKKDVCEEKKDVCEEKKDVCEEKKDVCEEKKDVCEEKKDVSEDTEVKVCEDRSVKVCEEKKDVCEEKKDVCKEKKDVCEEKKDVCEEKKDVCEEKKDVCEEKKDICEDTEVKVCEDTNVKVCEEKRDVCEEKRDVGEEKKDVSDTKKSEEDEEEDEVEFDDDERPACNTLTIDCQIKVYSDLSCPTRTIIIHKNDWVVYCDSRTRTPFWTVEVVGQCDLVKAKHRHCEAFRVAFKQAEDFRFGNPKNAKRLEVELVHAPKRRKTPKEKCSFEIQDEESPHQQYSCDYCKYSSFWNDFHQYIGFLLSSYEFLHICSGFLYLPEKEPEKDEIYEGLPEAELIPSHFFKVILAKNTDSTYRFECYKIPYERIKGECVELRKYLVTRDDLEREAGFVIFSDVPICYMKQASTHPCFPPSAVQEFFPANAYKGGRK